MITRSPDQPGVVYAGTSVGLIVSRDSGANWYRLSADATRSVAFDPDDSHRIFVATNEGVLRVDDRGAQATLMGKAARKR